MTRGALFSEEERRRLFPFVDDHVELAACAETPLPRPAHEALQGFYERYLRRGCRDFPRWLEELDRCRAVLARLIGADDPEDVALVKNTTAAAACLAHSLDLAPGEVILSNDREFPSNLWPWEDAAARAGARVERLGTAGGRPSAARVRERLAEPGAPPVRAVAWSWVQYRDGYRADPAALAEAAASARALVAVDGIQGLGVVPFDLRRSPVDAVYAGGHKWLMGIGGAGFLWVRRRRLGALEPFGRGWLSVPDPMAMRQDAAVHPGARRFEEGNLPIGLYLALRHSVELLLEVGVEAIFAHVLSMQDRLRERLEPRGWRALSSLEPAERGPILALAPPAGWPDVAEIARALDAEDVQLTARDGGLRVAPHLYSTAAEMDHVAERLEALG